MRLVVAITGASGAIFGIRALESLKALGVETHLVVSRWSRTTIRHETDYTLPQVEQLASFVHHEHNQSAPISSGSFKTDGMIIAPCSMKTLSAIRIGYSDTLICRAADVTLKERRKLVLLTRESPFSEIHLENMLALTRMGAVISPPVPAFYTLHKNIDDMVCQIVGRLLDQFGLDMPGVSRWSGFDPDA
ncbi:MAG TPA: UbiX family flavin prenyltransferase [Bryobacteraceae bacterium]|jgi:polyprenyl P-hydroxybenzoate/phenylacrylic acid decarboxylase-like protein|nr:UbiX family flavin prenyltransferase [Bryobacteraceae bacterium]